MSLTDEQLRENKIVAALYDGAAARILRGWPTGRYRVTVAVIPAEGGFTSAGVTCLHNDRDRREPPAVAIDAAREFLEAHPMPVTVLPGLEHDLAVKIEEAARDIVRRARPMPLDAALEVLKDCEHNGSRAWRMQAAEQPAPGATGFDLYDVVDDPSLGGSGRRLSAFEAKAIAERYSREVRGER